MSELEGIEEIAEQTSIRVNTRKKHGKLGWDISPNIERAAAAHEPKPAMAPTNAVLPEPIPAPATNDPVTSYTELMSAIQARVGVLGLKLTDFDDLAGFPAGLSGKVFGMLQVKRLGPEKVFDALRAAGLRLRVEVDPEQTGKMAIRISENYNPRQANQSRPGHASTPLSTAVLSRVFKPLGRMGGKKRWERVSKKDRSAHMTMMINARWKRERKKRKAANRRKQRETSAKVAEVVANV